MSTSKHYIPYNTLALTGFLSIIIYGVFHSLSLPVRASIPNYMNIDPTEELTLDEQQFLMWLETKTQAVLATMDIPELELYVRIYLNHKEKGLLHA